MNRAERRKRTKQGLPTPKEPVVNMKASDIEKIKEQAVETAFFYMMAIPVMVIHDKYPLLMRREVNGQSRAERFAELCIDLYDSVNNDFVTLDDLAQCLWDEAGIKIQRKQGGDNHV